MIDTNPPDINKLQSVFSDTRPIADESTHPLAKKLRLKLFEAIRKSTEGSFCLQRLLEVGARAHIKTSKNTAYARPDDRQIILYFPGTMENIDPAALITAARALSDLYEEHAGIAMPELSVGRHAFKKTVKEREKHILHRFCTICYEISMEKDFSGFLDSVKAHGYNELIMAYVKEFGRQ